MGMRSECHEPITNVWYSFFLWVVSICGHLYSHVCVCVCVRARVCVSCSVVSDSLWSHGLWPTRFLCLWNSPGKNTGVGSHFLLQGIFPSQGVNLGLPVLQTDSLLSEPPGKPQNLTNSYWTAHTHTRGKLGNGDAGLMPSVQKHIKGPSVMVETYSRSTMEQTAEMVNVGWTWGPGRGGLDSRVKQQEPSFLHSFSSMWNHPSSHGLSTSCPSFQAQPKHTLPWNHPGLVSLPAGSVYISHFSWRTRLILFHHLYTCTRLLTAPGG